MVDITNTHKIAIIGGGPKGMYGFERLAAQFKSNPPQTRIEIHMYNRSDSFAAGENYNTCQPSFLLINNPVGEVNMWPDEEPPPIISNSQTLTQWLRIEKGERVTEYDYVPRATVGQYLKEGFESIATNLPGNAAGKYMVGNVSDIYETGRKYGITLRTSEGKLQNVIHTYDHILLATGHPQNRLSESDIIVKKFADTCGKFRFIPFVYPTESALLNITPGSIVAIKGIGLTFVDAVLALTEGKGGKFQRDQTEKLLYKPSGSEPKVIYPFSRSGLPMIPRKIASGKITPLKYFTKKTLDECCDEGKIDFVNQVLPLLKKEMIYAFYEVEMRQSGFKEDLSACINFDEVKRAIDAYHELNPAINRFDPNTFLAPLNNKNFPDAGTFNLFIKAYLKFYLNEAKKGENISGWAAVTAVWRKATPLFGEFYSFGGLTPESHRIFDKLIRGRLNRVTFGPPEESIEKIVALMEAGVLNFELAENPVIRLDKIKGTAALTSKKYNIRRIVQYLIDARISKVSLPDDRNSLYRNLLDRGMISMFENKSDHYSYQPGCIAISRDGFIIDSNGIVNMDIAVTGTPTEGITFDNDSLSRKRNNFVKSWADYTCKKYTRSTIEQHAS